MKLMKFPAQTYIIRAVCDCGGELKYVGTSYAGMKGMVYDHTCRKCKTSEQLTEIYPKVTHEQSSVVGEDT